MSVSKKLTVKQALEQPERDIMPLCNMGCCSLVGCALLPDNLIDFECLYLKDCYYYKAELLD
jgi:hypothetical protein